MKEKTKEFMTRAGTDTSGKWMGVEHAEKFAELIVQECIGIAEDTRHDGKVVAARIKFAFGIKE